MDDSSLMLKKIDDVVIKIDKIWENVNLAEFKKGNEELIQLISDIENIISVFSENRITFHNIIVNLNDVMEAMERGNYVLEADILKYELKDIFLEYKKTLVIN